MIKQALKAAFPHTIPILTGYIFLGTAYGFLMHTKGFGIGWTAFASVFIFAGAMQYVGITLLTSTFHPLYVLMLTLIINARHLFYGISMLEKYNGAGKRKFFLIFGMADEAFSINCSAEVPKGIDKHWFYFFVTLFHYLYWLSCSCIGNLMGGFISFNTKGIDFVLTALFVVIFVNQWISQKRHTAALIGLLGSAACLIFFGQTYFMIPAMAVIVIFLFFFKNRVEQEVN